MWDKNQKTLSNETSFSGIGLHSGEKVEVKLIPTNSNSGIIFKRTDLKKNNEFKKISEHLEIIYNDTISIFKKNNIEQIDCINKKLDPNFHQAMLEVEDDSKEAGTIVQEIQKGFLMKDRLLRPSLVGVSKKSKKEDNKDNKTKENEHKNDEK